MKVGVIGATGFLGRNLCDALDEHNIEYVRGSTNTLDARQTDYVMMWVNRNKITHIVNLAAICGGIGLNKKYPFKLWLATTQITAAVLEAASKLNIKRMVMLGTVCSYAAECPVPFSESDLMDHGWPEETNRAYGLAKLNGLVGGQAASKELNMDVINLIPVNMYGPYDHFDLEFSHVIPALINKIDNAVKNGYQTVGVWGSGKASREFLYAGDCAEAIISALLLDEPTNELINIGNGQEVPIRHLVNMIANELEFDGWFAWDEDKPDGQMRRCLNIQKAKDILGWEAKTSLEEGLRKTIQWYKEEWTCN